MAMEMHRINNEWFGRAGSSPRARARRTLSSFLPAATEDYGSEQQMKAVLERVIDDDDDYEEDDGDGKSEDVEAKPFSGYKRSLQCEPNDSMKTGWVPEV